MADLLPTETQYKGNKKWKFLLMNAITLQNVRRNQKYIKDNYMLEKKWPTSNTAKLWIKLSHYDEKQSLCLKKYWPM